MCLNFILIPLYNFLNGRNSDYNIIVEELDNSPICSICLDEESSENIYAITECNHKFHHKCLTTWLNVAKHPTCPNCRYSILKYDTNELETLLFDND